MPDTSKQLILAIKALARQEQEMLLPLLRGLLVELRQSDSINESGVPYLTLTKEDAVDRVKRLELAVARLPTAELKTFREWFVRFDAELWDKQIESDIEAGKLDALAEVALQALRTGGAKEM